MGWPGPQVEDSAVAVAAISHPFALPPSGGNLADAVFHVACTSDVDFQDFGDRKGVVEDERLTRVRLRERSREANLYEFRSECVVVPLLLGLRWRGRDLAHHSREELVDSHDLWHVSPVLADRMVRLRGVLRYGFVAEYLVTWRLIA